MNQIQTPWGCADHIEEIAPGIARVCTRSHGGFKLSAERNLKIPEALKAASFNRQGEHGWYEEDCDWAIVCLAFPEHFSESDRGHAIQTFARWIAPKMLRLQ